MEALLKVLLCSQTNTCLHSSDVSILSIADLVYSPEAATALLAHHITSIQSALFSILWILLKHAQHEI